MAAESGAEGERTAQRCEAFFHAGTLRMAAGEGDAARALLQKCVDAGREGEPELQAARAALATPPK